MAKDSSFFSFFLIRLKLRSEEGSYCFPICVFWMLCSQCGVDKHGHYLTWMQLLNWGWMSESDWSCKVGNPAMDSPPENPSHSNFQSPLAQRGKKAHHEIHLPSLLPACRRTEFGDKAKGKKMKNWGWEWDSDWRSGWRWWWGRKGTWNFLFHSIVSWWWWWV